MKICVRILNEEILYVCMMHVNVTYDTGSYNILIFLSHVDSRYIMMKDGGYYPDCHQSNIKDISNFIGDLIFTLRFG